jgi:glycosyltransferase involved in cell wall biosynthesis
LIVAAIPAFNEEKNIAKVILLAKRYVDKVIVCDDGSTDMTAAISESLGARVARHERNLGYGAALSTLFGEARRENADIAVTLDADGQHDPSDIAKLVAPLSSNEADIVIGSRFLRPGSASMPKYRRVGLAAVNRVSNTMGYAGLTDSQSGYRAYNRKALEAIVPSEMGMGASTEILVRANEAGLRIAEIPIEVTYDKESSTHNPVYHGIDVLLSTFKYWSIKHPLLVYGAPGAGLFILSLGFWWWMLSIFDRTHRVVTNIALIAVASTIVGLVLLAVAVMLWILISVVRERRP